METPRSLRFTSPSVFFHTVCVLERALIFIGTRGSVELEAGVQESCEEVLEEFFCVQK